MILPVLTLIFDIRIFGRSNVKKLKYGEMPELYSASYDEIVSKSRKREAEEDSENLLK